VYVAGISAGAAMAVILGATYPDVFAAIGAVAGLEFRAANGLIAGLRAMKHGGPDPNQQGATAFQAMSFGLAKRDRRRMPIIIFHGNADSYVHPANADQLVDQWAVTNHMLCGNKDSDPDTAGELTNSSVAGGYAYQKYAYKDAPGRLLMEKWMVEGLGHAWPGSPVPAPYADPKGPNASEEMWRFFSQTAAESLATPSGRRMLWDRSVGLLHGAAQYVSERLRGQKD
ncbi:MAG: PHB depolymerase family esterase, partial [Terriglobales bacterium]